MKLLLSALFTLIAHAEAKTIKVVVVDTGARFNSEVSWCNTGHTDFSGFGLYDKNGHGHNVANLIAKNTHSKYCIVVVRFYGDQYGRNNTKNWVRAIEYATTLKPDIINLSGGGVVYSFQEARAIKRALDSGIKIVAAAGNEQTWMSPLNCSFFPACSDPRVIKVGCLGCKRSNYGPSIDVWENGNEAEGGGITLSGTSQATAIHTGKLIDTLSTIKGNR